MARARAPLDLSSYIQKHRSPPGTHDRTARNPGANSGIDLVPKTRTAAWATETIGNPRYPLELFLRVITVSLETMKVVRGLPALDIAASPAK